MNEEQIEQMRINSRRVGTTARGAYHAGALDMQDKMTEKVYKALENILAKQTLDKLLDIMKGE